MKALMAGAFAATFAAGASLVAMPVGAMTPIEMPGGDAFEAKLSQQVEDANAEAESRLRNDPTLAGMDTTAETAAPEPAVREAITIDKKVEGVPGDETFEAAFAAWLRQGDEALKDQLSRDPTGLGKMR